MSTVASGLWRVKPGESTLVLVSWLMSPDGPDFFPLNFPELFF